MPGAIQVFAPSPTEGRLLQGEVLANLVEWKVVINDRGEAEADAEVHPFAVVLTQDCDLLQDDDARQDAGLDAQKRENRQLSHLMVVVAGVFEGSKKFDNSRVRAHAKTNQDARFHYLAPATREQDRLGIGIPALVLDFKRIFSVRMDAVLDSVGRGETVRRTVMQTPYVEHLNVRVGHFLQRVPLPVDHHDVAATVEPSVPNVLPGQPVGQAHPAGPTIAPPNASGGHFANLARIVLLFLLVALGFVLGVLVASRWT